jgi:hypothetical protein
VRRLAAALAGSAVALASCATRREGDTSLKADLSDHKEGSRTVDTSEPVAVPERVEIEGWGAPAPLTITPGIGRLLPVGPGAGPPPRPPKALPGLAPQDAAAEREDTLHWRATVFYGPPQDKTTHEADTGKADTGGSIDSNSHWWSSMKASLFGLGPGWIIGIVLAGLAGAAYAFRKQIPWLRWIP